MKVVALTLLALSLLSHTVLTQHLTPEQWHADISYFGQSCRVVTRNLYQWMKREDFEAAGARARWQSRHGERR